MYAIYETSGQEASSRTPRRKSFWGIVAGATVLAGIAIALLLMPVFGYRVYVVTGDSMEGSLGRGALILTKAVPVGSLKVGDIITFRPPYQSAPVTHRIISVTTGDDGRPVFQTKGDHNDFVDPWPFTLNQSKQAKYVAHVPYLGYLFGFLAIRAVRATLIAIFGLLLLFAVFSALWQKAARPVPIPEEKTTSKAETGPSRKPLRPIGAGDDANP